MDTTPRGQQGLVTARQLRAAGLTSGAVTRLVASGGLVRVHRAVYAAAPLPPLPRRLVDRGAVSPVLLLHVRAAVLSLGAGACAHGTTAALVRGWDLLVEPGRVEFVVGGQRGRAHLDGVVVRRSRRHRSHALLASPSAPGLAPLPVTGAVQTALACALALPLLEAVVAVDSALRSGQVTLRRLRAAAARLPGVGDAARVRRVLALADPRSGSVLESVLRFHLLAAGVLGFETQRVVHGPQGRLLRADFCFAAARLLVETDGAAWHDPAADRRLDNALAAAGWRVLRYTWEQVVHEPGLVVAEVRAALRCSDTQSAPAAPPRAV